MFFNERLDDNNSSDLILTAEIKAYLSETAKWAKFISIVGFVFIVLMVIGSLIVIVFMGSITSELADASNAGLPFSPIFFTLFYLVIALIMLIPILYLYKFASKMRLALNESDNLALTNSFKNLKSLYKFYGIYILIGLCIYALMFLVGIIGSIVTSMGFVM